MSSTKVDVNAFAETARRWYPDVAAKPPGPVTDDSGWIIYPDGTSWKPPAFGVVPTQRKGA